MIIEIALGVLLGGVLLITIPLWLPFVLELGGVVIGLVILFVVLIGIFLATKFLFSNLVGALILAGLTTLVMVIIYGIYRLSILWVRCSDHPNWKLRALPGTIFWMFIPLSLATFIMFAWKGLYLYDLAILGVVLLIYFSMYGVWLKDFHWERDEAKTITQDDEAD